jgi:CRISPR-associated protein Csm2
MPNANLINGRIDITFYSNPDKRTLKPDLFSSTAEELAKLFANEGKANRRSQVRKFYDEAVRLNTMTKANPGDWEYILPYVNMLVAKAAYALGRDLVSGDFVSFIKLGVGQIQIQEDLDAFTNLFEAFIGFFRQYQKNN